MSLPWSQVGLALADATARTAAQVFSYSGKGDKHGADHTAVETMRAELQALPYRMTVVIGEGEKDQAPMLYSGERLGSRADDAPGLDLVVDPLECTTNFSRGLPDSMVVLAATTEGTVQPVPGTYMEQMLLPPHAADLLDEGVHLETDVREVLSRTAQRLGRSVPELTVVIQDRPRHKELIEAVRREGAGVSLIESGSISAALEVATQSGGRLSIMWGVYGAPEGLVIAFLAALTGAGFLGRVRPHDARSEEQTRLLRLEGRTLRAEDWMHGEGVLLCSGLHSNSLVPGVERANDGLRVTTLLWTHAGRSLITHAGGRRVSVREF